MAKQFKKKKGSQKKKQLQSNFPTKKETSEIKDGVISYEEGIKALEQVQQNMFSDIVEYIVYAIDSYEEDVDEVDTQDPLFGLYQEVEDIDNE